MTVRRERRALVGALVSALIVPAFVALVGAAPAFAASTINVPADQPTIQAGINAASNGDTVVVASGTYHEHISFNGKAIEVRSSDGPGSTIIDGDSTGDVVEFIHGEGSGSVLRGLTIQHGSLGIDIGGTPGPSPIVVGNVITLNERAVQASDGGPTIESNSIVGNAGCEEPGLIIGGSSAVVSSNTITGNQQVGCSGGISGAGITIEGSGTLVENNSVVGNPNNGTGGGITIAGGSDGSIVRNNTVRKGGNGITFGGGASSLQIVQNVVADNGLTAMKFSYQDMPGTFVVAENTITGNAHGIELTYWASHFALYNNIVTDGISCPFSEPPTLMNNNASSYGELCAPALNVNGNISADPQFVNTTFNNYRLKATSPSIDTGTNAAPSQPSNDLDGNARVVSGTIDQGAYEYQGTEAVEATGEFTPVTPDRILDTRNGNGLPGGTPAKVGSGKSIALQIEGRDAIPATGVSAVVINVTATSTVLPYYGYVTVYPDDGGAVPVAANLNFAPGETRPNLVTVKVGADGKIRLFNGVGSIDLVGDVMGFYSTSTGPAGSRFHGAAPLRRIDTRFGTGGHRIGPNEALTLDVRGQGDVPPTGVTAIVMNVTAVNPTPAFGWLTAYPGDLSTAPLSANLNFVAGETVPNLVVVRVPTTGPDAGLVKIENGDYGTTDVVVDVVGWYDDVKTTEAGRLIPLAPTRQFDTRFDFGGDPVGPDEGVQLTFDDTVGAVVINTAITGPTAASWLTVYPYNNDPPPLAANMNWTPGLTEANLVMVKTGGAPDSYSVAFVNGDYGDVHIIADLNGYFTSSTVTPQQVAQQTTGEATAQTPKSTRLPAH